MPVSPRKPKLAHGCPTARRQPPPSGSTTLMSSRSSASPANGRRPRKTTEYGFTFLTEADAKECARLQSRTLERRERGAARRQLPGKRLAARRRSREQCNQHRLCASTRLSLASRKPRASLDWQKGAALTPRRRGARSPLDYFANGEDSPSPKAGSPVTGWACLRLLPRGIEAVRKYSSFVQGKATDAPAEPGSPIILKTTVQPGSGLQIWRNMRVISSNERSSRSMIGCLAVGPWVTNSRRPEEIYGKKRKRDAK